MLSFETSFSIWLQNQQLGSLFTHSLFFSSTTEMWQASKGTFLGNFPILFLEFYFEKFSTDQNHCRTPGETIVGMFSTPILAWAKLHGYTKIVYGLGLQAGLSDALLASLLLDRVVYHGIPLETVVQPSPWKCSWGVQSMEKNEDLSLWCSVGNRRKAASGTVSELAHPTDK